MSDGQARGIVVAHGAMAEGMVDAVRGIAGCDADALASISNRGLSPSALAEQVGIATGKGPAIVFTDLPSGSCGFAARLLARDKGGLAVICGVNLPMLLDFVMHRDLPLDELVSRLVNKGRTAIHGTPSTVRPNGDPAVPH